MSTQDSSLRSEWQTRGVFCHSERAILPSLSFWTRHPPLFVILNELSPFHCHSELAFGRGRIPTVIAWDWVAKVWTLFKYDPSYEYARFFTTFRMTFQGCCLSFWTSHSPQFVILNELSLFHCHSELAFGRGRIPTVIARDLKWETVSVFYLWFVLWARKILHCVQNDIPGCFSYF